MGTICFHHITFLFDVVLSKFTLNYIESIIFTIISATKTSGQLPSLMFVLRDKKHEDFYFDKDNNFHSG